MDFSNILFSPTRKAKPTCSNCGSDTHKRSTCPNLPCSMCKENGHVSPMCPTVDELRAMCTENGIHTDHGG